MAIALPDLAIHREEDAGSVAPVHEPMAVRHVLRKSRAIAGAQHGLALILDQHRLALQHDEELVDPFMPMALAGNPARIEHDMTDAKLGQPARRPDPSVMPPAHLRRIRHRVTGAVGLFDRVDIELRHFIPPAGDARPGA